MEYKSLLDSCFYIVICPLLPLCKRASAVRESWVFISQFIITRIALSRRRNTTSAIRSEKADSRRSAHTPLVQLVTGSRCGPSQITFNWYIPLITIIWANILCNWSRWSRQQCKTFGDLQGWYEGFVNDSKKQSHTPTSQRKVFRSSPPHIWLIPTVLVVFRVCSSKPVLWNTVYSD